MLKKFIVTGVVLGLLTVPVAVKAAVHIPTNLMAVTFDDPQQQQHQTEGDEHQADLQDNDKDVADEDSDVQEDQNEDQNDDAEVKANVGDKDELDANENDTEEDRASDAEEDLQLDPPKA